MALLIAGLSSAMPVGTNQALAHESAAAKDLLERVEAALRELREKTPPRGEWTCSVFCREAEGFLYRSIDGSFTSELVLTTSSERLKDAWTLLAAQAETRCARFYTSDTAAVLYVDGIPSDGLFKDKYRRGEVVVASIRNACILDPGAGAQSSGSGAKAASEGASFVMTGDTHPGAAKAN